MTSDQRGTPQTLDDGAYGHLEPGMAIPDLELPSTTGGRLGLVAPTPWTVIFLYPATGTPGVAASDEWLAVPGAYGCTAESCGFRDLVDDFAAAGAQLRGVSTQDPEEQATFADHHDVGYPLLSDHEHALIGRLNLPTFRADGSPPRIRRATLLVSQDRRLKWVTYPIADPAGHPAEVLAQIRRLGEAA